MKISEIITEMPAMVPQTVYPKQFEDDARRAIEGATHSRSFKEVFRSNNITIKTPPDVPTQLFLFENDKSVAIMHLAEAHVQLGVPVWQVWNVFVLPEYRNRRFGMMLYNFVLHERKEAFASGAAMTPSSRRIYTSLFRDSTVDVYALVNKERQELSIGPDGVTTGDSKTDNNSIFIAIAK